MIENQKKVAQVAEMVHGTCLYHDDVIDDAIKRSAKSTINFHCGQKKVVYYIAKQNVSCDIVVDSFLRHKSIWAGDFVLGRTLETISQIPSKEVCILLTRVRIDSSYLIPIK